MKKFNKMLSVLLSLVLCLGMAAPAFAATYDLSAGNVTVSVEGTCGFVVENGVTAGEATLQKGDFDVHIVQAGDGTTGHTIEVTGGDNVKITLEDNVLTSGRALTVTGGDATLDLNGHDLAHDSACKDDGKTGTGTVVVVKGEGAGLTIQDSSASEDGDGADGTGRITGGTGSYKIDNEKITGSYEGFGGGVIIKDGAKVTLESGSITGNTSKKGGAGVTVDANSKFIMNGGSIDNNHCIGDYGWGGGVIVSEVNSCFEMHGGTISHNTARQGAGVNVNEDATFEMTGGTIEENETRGFSSEAYKDHYGGGVCVVAGSFKMSGGAIRNNKSKVYPLSRTYF